MKQSFKMIKPLDIIIVLSLIIFSFLPILIFSHGQASQMKNASDLVAVILVNNEEVKRIPLSGNTETEVFDIYSDDGGVNRVEVNQDKIRVIYADCPDQIDVKQGYISKPGETIICLPHKFVIEIQSETAAEDEIIISQ